MSFDASVTTLGVQGSCLVMHGCIHLIQPAHSHFYSPVFKKRTGGIDFSSSVSGTALINRLIVRITDRRESHHRETRHRESRRLHRSRRRDRHHRCAPSRSSPQERKRSAPVSLPSGFRNSYP